MKHLRNWLGPLAIAALALVLAHCGNGSGTLAGIGGTGITTSGTITALGSIFVNGVEYDTTQSTVKLNGSSGDASALQVGMVVRVQGTLAADGIHGTASSVEFEDSLTGPITNVATPGGTKKTLTVLGVQVEVDSTTTRFSGTRFTGLAIDDVIEVSGFYDRLNDKLVATFVKKEGTFTNGDSVEIKGTVKTIGANSLALDRSSLAIDASSSLLGTVKVGDFVEVQGTLDSGSAGPLTATGIESKQEGLGSEVENASLEGIITDYVNDSDFRIDGQRVDASQATLNPSGLSLGDGLRVEAKGPIRGGVMQATEIKQEN